VAARAATQSVGVNPIRVNPRVHPKVSYMGLTIFPLQIRLKAAAMATVIFVYTHATPTDYNGFIPFFQEEIRFLIFPERCLSTHATLTEAIVSSL